MVIWRTGNGDLEKSSEALGPQSWQVQSYTTSKSWMSSGLAALETVASEMTEALTAVCGYAQWEQSWEINNRNEK